MEVFQYLFKAITCPNATVFDIKNGSPVCTDRNHTYDSSCKTQCDRGYGLPSGIIFSTCQEDKTWSTDLPDCEGMDNTHIFTKKKKQKKKQNMAVTHDACDINNTSS